MDAELKEKIQERESLPNWIYKNDEGKNKVCITKLGQELLKNNNLMYVTDRTKENLYVYFQNTGTWAVQPESYLRNLVHKELVRFNKWNDKTERQTINFLKGEIPKKGINQTFNPSIMPLVFNFKNNVFNWKTMKMESHSPKYYFTASTDYELTTEIKNTPETDKYFNLIFGEDKLTMMQALGGCFYPSYENVQYIILLKGNGGDGKSWFLTNYINPLIGNDSVAHISLFTLASANNSNINFYTSGLYRKYANSSSELSENANGYLDTAELKRDTSGEIIETPRKNKGNIKFMPYAKLFFATNELVKFKDDKEGFSRRINIINFKKISNFNNEINLNRLKEERGAFAYKCIVEFKKLLNSGSICLFKSYTNEKAVKEWMLENDNIQQFIEDCLIEVPESSINKRDLYQAYTNWCGLNEVRRLKMNGFFSKLREKGLDYREERPYKNNPQRIWIKKLYGYELGIDSNPEGKYNPAINIDKKQHIYF